MKGAFGSSSESCSRSKGSRRGSTEAFGEIEHPIRLKAAPSETPLALPIRQLGELPGSQGFLTEQAAVGMVGRPVGATRHPAVSLGVRGRTAGELVDSMLAFGQDPGS